MNILPLLFVFLLITFQGFSQHEGFTFEVDDVKPAKSKLNEVTFDVFAENHFKQQVYSFPEEMKNKNIVANRGNGFLNTVRFAYDDHRPLELSPDVVWLLLCQNFGDHVSANKDSLEFLLLKEDHPKVITVRNDNLTYSNDKEWSHLMASFSDEIEAYSKESFKNLLVQEFSTTTPTIRSVYHATHMDITSHYIAFRSHTMCGFPSITLLGTTEDWRKIYNEVDKFSKFGLEQWVKELKPVLMEFVLASEGNPTIDFWQSFYKSVQVYDVNVISGWILKFYPYLRKTINGVDTFSPNPYLEGKKYLLSEIGSESLSKGFKETEFVWLKESLDTVIQDTLLLYSGFYGILQDPETGAIQPNISWVITSRDSKSTRKDWKIYRQEDDEKLKHTIRWNPELLGDAAVKPIYKPKKNDSFEKSIETLKYELIQSDLFKDSDDINIIIYIAHEGTAMVHKVKGATPEQEDYIRSFIACTSGKWSPASGMEYSGITGAPVNFVFILAISFN